MGQKANGALLGSSSNYTNMTNEESYGLSVITGHGGGAFQDKNRHNMVPDVHCITAVNLGE